MLPGTYDEEDGVGIRHDVLADARAEIGNAIHVLNEMNVDLDSLADDREGIWTEDERAALRSMQREVRELMREKEDDLQEITEEFERVKEAMDDD